MHELAVLNATKRNAICC